MQAMSNRGKHPSGLGSFNERTGYGQVNGTTVGQCLNDLVNQFPVITPKIFDKKSKLLNYVDIYVN